MTLYRHGDLIFKQLDKLPEGLKKLDLNNKSFTLALGEVTGHKHVIVAEKDEDMKIYQDAEGHYVLEIGAPTKLSHEEHNTLTFQPGIYIMGNEREHDYFEKAARQVLD
jgi:hypothetical protein